MRRWLPLSTRPWSAPASLIPAGAQALDRQQTAFLRDSIRQLTRHGAWEQAWALIELSNEVHRYNPLFSRACEQERARLLRRLHPSRRRAARMGGAPPLDGLPSPFGHLSGAYDQALIAVDPQWISYWGCITYPGLGHGRFRGRKQRRFCNAVVDERFVFRGLALAKDPQVRILRRRFEEGLSWEASGGKALWHETRLRTDKTSLSWARFEQRQLAWWDQLFDTIRRDGYFSQAQLLAQGAALGRRGLFNEIEVAINAAGDLLFLEGKHRLVIAQVLRLPRVPVLVNVWSRQVLERLDGPYTPALAETWLARLASPGSPALSAG
ncbi:MAG: hypothetical protein FJ070_01195 [Cyanobacteria bacterium K_DeepCast_150m_m2_101]|nr:hypothetical protein [Cyanobacteria bacterium K_DeepCast_0m_m1_088]MBM5818694.1 hypothetical protein [Cyanobacteria bacterium K_DeepCast_150m_m2_101]